MCCVIGYSPVRSALDPNKVAQQFERLFREGTVRGLHAFGMATSDGHLEKSFNAESIIHSFDPYRSTIAHSRYCTSGGWEVLENNQPVRALGYTLVFNGVIHMGTKEEMEREFKMALNTENDGEVFLRLLHRRPSRAAQVLKSLKGSFAGCWFNPAGRMYAARNKRRPLWMTYEFGATWFASTRDIFRRAGFTDKMDEVRPGVIYE